MVVDTNTGDVGSGVLTITPVFFIAHCYSPWKCPIGVGHSNQPWTNWPSTVFPVTTSSVPLFISSVTSWLLQKSRSMYLRTMMRIGSPLRHLPSVVMTTVWTTVFVPWNLNCSDYTERGLYTTPWSIPTVLIMNNTQQINRLKLMNMMKRQSLKQRDINEGKSNRGFDRRPIYVVTR